MREQSLFPIATDVILDVIPVDMVASAVLAVTAQALVEEPELVFQVSSGDTNPSKLGRLVDLLGPSSGSTSAGKREAIVS